MLGIIVILKNIKTVPNQILSRRNGIVNENLPVLFSIRDPINSDNIPNTAGRNSAPPRLQALIYMWEEELERWKNTVCEEKSPIMPFLQESVWLGMVLFFSITMIPSTLLMPGKSFWREKQLIKYWQCYNPNGLGHRCQTPVLEGRCVCWFSGCSQHPWFIQVIDWLKNR